VTVTDAAREKAASEVVNRYAPTAPASVKAQATTMLAESMRIGPETQISQGGQSVSFGPTGDRANLIHRSGASGILAPWRRPRARAVKDD